MIANSLRNKSYDICKNYGKIMKTKRNGIKISLRIYMNIIFLEYLMWEPDRVTSCYLILHDGGANRWKINSGRYGKTQVSPY